MEARNDIDALQYAYRQANTVKLDVQRTDGITLTQGNVIEIMQMVYDEMHFKIQCRKSTTFPIMPPGTFGTTVEVLQKVPERIKKKSGFEARLAEVQRLREQNKRK